MLRINQPLENPRNEMHSKKHKQVPPFKKFSSIPIFLPKTRDKRNIWATHTFLAPSISYANAGIFKSNRVVHGILVKWFRTADLQGGL